MKFNFSRIHIGILTAPIVLAGSGILQAADAPQRYQDECSRCHGELAEFVSYSLEFRDGSLTGLGSEKPVAEFLKNHRGLKHDDIEYYVDLLKRVADEVGLR